MTSNSLLGLRASPQRTIPTPDGDITVRGLGLHSVVTLFQRRAEEMAGLYSQVIENDGERVSINAERVNALSELMLVEAPSLVAEIITLGCGEYSDEAYLRARELSFPAQIAVLEAVADLTFSSEMPPKKVFEIVMRAVAAVLPGLSAPKA